MGDTVILGDAKPEEKKAAAPADAPKPADAAPATPAPATPAPAPAPEGGKVNPMNTALACATCA